MLTAGDDPERIAEAVPASSGNNQEGEGGYAVGWAPHPPIDRAPNPDPGRPSRPGAVDPRPARLQPGSIRQRRGSRRQPPHGIHALRRRRAPLRRAEPGHTTGEARSLHHTPAPRLPPRADVPARAVGAHAAPPPARRADRLHQIIGLFFYLFLLRGRKKKKKEIKPA